MNQKRHLSRMKFFKLILHYIEARIDDKELPVSEIEIFGHKFETLFETL